MMSLLFCSYITRSSSERPNSRCTHIPTHTHTPCAKNCTGETSLALHWWLCRTAGGSSCHETRRWVGASCARACGQRRATCWIKKACSLPGFCHFCLSPQAFLECWVKPPRGCRLSGSARVGGSAVESHTLPRSSPAREATARPAGVIYRKLHTTVDAQRASGRVQPFKKSKSYSDPGLS